MVLGEALVDLLESGADNEIVYRPAIGGAPLNVAVGIVRLGGAAELFASVGADAFGTRIRNLLREVGVGDVGVVTVQAQTTLAVTSFAGSKPEFSFYGEPRSYALLGPDDIDEALVARASVLYCGSIALLSDRVRSAARRAWAVPGPVRAFDPNIRANLLTDPARVREIVEEFAATADIVKLSADDATLLYAEPPQAVAEHLARLGAGVVVLTLGSCGALVLTDGHSAQVEGVAVRAVDTTGAGDCVMATLLAGVLETGLPADLPAWLALVSDAMRVAALVCERAGGASAMPTRSQVDARFPQQAEPSGPAE